MVRRLSSCNLLMDDDGTPSCDLKDTYRCSSSSSSASSSSSLPVFLPLITTLEIGFFLYFLTNYSSDAAVESTTTTTTTTKRSGHLAAAAGSCFVYRPDRRNEVWRFALYMFVHAGWWHLVFNVVVQLLVGAPLEMKHGPIRIATIYMSGVLAGSLATSMFDSEAFLVGASGAVYALIAAHLANILLNYSEMDLALVKLAAICTVAIADVGFTLWDRRSSDDAGSAIDPLASAAASTSPPVSYVTHFVGALSGLFVGIVVLRRPKQKPRPRILWWTALSLTLTSFSFAVLWNIFAL